MKPKLLQLAAVFLFAAAGCSPAGPTYNDALIRFKQESEALDRTKREAEVFTQKITPQVSAIDDRERERLAAVNGRWSVTKDANVRKQLAGKGPDAYREVLLTKFINNGQEIDQETSSAAKEFLNAYPMWASEVQRHVLEAAEARRIIDERNNPEAARLLREVKQQEDRVEDAKVIRDSLAPRPR